MAFISSNAFFHSFKTIYCSSSNLRARVTLISKNQRRLHLMFHLWLKWKDLSSPQTSRSVGSTYSPYAKFGVKVKQLNINDRTVPANFTKLAHSVPAVSSYITQDQRTVLLTRLCFDFQYLLTDIFRNLLNSMAGIDTWGVVETNWHAQVNLVWLLIIKEKTLDFCRGHCLPSASAINDFPKETKEGHMVFRHSSPHGSRCLPWC